MKKKRSRWVYNVLILFFLGVMVYSAARLIPELMQGYQDHKTKEETTALAKKKEEEQTVLDPDWASLQKRNSQIVGWIYVPDTAINYPIVQGSDNQFYLDHSSLQEANGVGAIFLDAQASASLQDRNTIIYGHSITNSNQMFTDLAYFEQASFFEEHPYFYLLTPEQSYRCEVAAFVKTTDESWLYRTTFTTTQDWLAYLEQTRMDALYTRESDGDAARERRVLLSTCDLDYGVGQKYRLLLSARLQEWEEDIVLS